MSLYEAETQLVGKVLFPFLELNCKESITELLKANFNIVTLSGSKF